MLRAAVAAVTALTALSLTGSASVGLSAPTGGTPLAWVSVAGRSELVEVDLDSKRVTAHVALASRPGEITSSGDLREVLVASPAAGTVTLVNGIARRVEAVFRGLGRPSAVAFGAAAVQDGRSRYAYATDERRGDVVVLDLRRKRVVSRLRVGPRPDVLAVGDLVWLAQGTTHPRLTGFDISSPARPRPTMHVPTRSVVRDVALQPDTANLYVTFRDSRLLAKLDWGTRRVVWRRNVGDVVGSLAFDVYAGDRAWVAAPQSGRLLLVSARSGHVLRTVSGCRGAADVTLVGTRWLVAACAAAGAIAIYDTVTGRRALVPAGLRPVGVAGIVG